MKRLLHKKTCIFIHYLTKHCTWILLRHYTQYFHRLPSHYIFHNMGFHQGLNPLRPCHPTFSPSSLPISDPARAKHLRPAWHLLERSGQREGRFSGYGMPLPFHARIPTPYLPRNSVWIPQNFSSYGCLLPPTFLPPLRSTDQEAVAASGATHGGWSVPDEKLDAPGSNILQNVKTLL